MKKRYWYVALFGVPAFFIAGIFSAIAMAMMAGILWVFLLDYDSWPSWINTWTPIAFIGIWATLWGMACIQGFRIGKDLENDPKFNKRHLWTSIGITLADLIIVAWYAFADL